jgi:hypothetical protein
LLDWAAGGSDAIAFADAGWFVDPADHSRGMLVVRGVDGVSHAKAKGIASGDLVALVARRAKELGATVYADQFERFSLENLFGLQSVRYVSLSWTAPLKEAAVGRVRQWLRDGVLSLPQHEILRREFLAFEERISTSTGALTFRARHSGHDDYAMLIVLLGLLDIQGLLHGSPGFEAQRQHREQRDLVQAAELALYAGGQFGEMGEAALEEMLPEHIDERSTQGERRRVAQSVVSRVPRDELGISWRGRVYAANAKAGVAPGACTPEQADEWMSKINPNWKKEK